MTASAPATNDHIGQTVSDAIRNIKKKLKELFNERK